MTLDASYNIIWYIHRFKFSFKYKYQIKNDTRWKQILDAKRWQNDQESLTRRCTSLYMQYRICISWREQL